MTYNPDEVDFASIKNLIDPGYRNMDLARTIDYFTTFFVEACPLEAEQMEKAVIGDFGCGYGWLSFAFALHTPAKIIAMDLDADRIETGKKIASLLGVEEKIDWRVGSLTDMPFHDQSITVGYSIEAVEHIYGDDRAFAELTRVCSQYLVVTTPNKWFPLIAHDTRLPFCHWLPTNARNAYAKLCGREQKQDGNIFWSEMQLRQKMSNFRRISGFMQFQNINDYLQKYPTYLPYNGGELRDLSKAKRFYSIAASKLGTLSPAILPNLGGVWQRTQ